MTPEIQKNPEKPAKKSVLGKIWQEKPFCQRKFMAISQKLMKNDAICQILSTKNLEFDEIDDFLEPKIKNLLPNPFDLIDMKKAVDFLVDRIKKHKKITIFADYDVDGATSSAILKRYLAQINVAAEIYIPDRILEGYGPNCEALKKIKNSGSDLVITLDCGTVAFEPLETAKEIGLDVIVIDHHKGVLEVPKAIAVINPNRLDENFPIKDLCAASVVFFFIIAINKTLREEDFFKQNNLKEPNLLNLLDLVALGTVCDVMPLTKLNRAFVDAGLKIMKNRQNLGIKTLFDKANIHQKPNSYHLGFVLGPRINAGGRVGTANLGAEILSTNDEQKAFEIANQLEEFNIERKDLEKQALDEAISDLEKQQNQFGNFTKDDNVIFAVSKNWHQGVIGIVASRLKDLYQKPVVVISLDENNKGKSSCRSITGVDIGAAILNARSQNLVIEGGGHAMAGGFSIKAEKISELHQYFCQNLSKDIEFALKNQVFEYDIALDLENVNLEFLKSLEILEPFGNQNPKPKFLIRDLLVLNERIIGKDQNHISCILSKNSSIGFKQILKAVSFKSVENEIGEILLRKKKKKLDFIGDLSINKWNEKEEIQLIIEDIIEK